MSARVGPAAISTDGGGIAVLAIDHRDSMRRFLSPSAPDAVPGEEITALKKDIVAALVQFASGVMLETEFSIPQLLEAGLVPDHVGVIAALEAQGYLDDPSTAVTSVLPDWSPLLALQSGAAMVKLLLPYRPGSPLAGTQERVAKEVLAECAQAGITLVLEPLLWGEGDAGNVSNLIVESVQRFVCLGPGVMKVPFPGDLANNRTQAIDACAEISELCAQENVPWALLSGGGSFERFAEQLHVALATGCSGFMVGRALWGEAAMASQPERSLMLSDVVVPRMRQLRSLVDQHKPAPFRLEAPQET
jgi:tagatose-1,6-bisphosphate aldolase